MDERLYKAALEGNVESLLSLIQEDALILDRDNVANTFLETPLHIAAMLGHEQLAMQLLRLRPGLARELDSQGSSPLHLASAKGNLAIVKACLQVSDPNVCILRNREGKNPVHLAAMKGRVSVLEELLRVKPDAGRAIVERTNQSILHLCVESGQFEALKLLVRSGQFEDMVNLKDKSGNTILHLAIAEKQPEITDFLLGISVIDTSALNHKGMTPIDILLQRGKDDRDLEIQESLVRSSAKITVENSSNHGIASRPNDEHNSSRVPQKYKPIKRKNDWIERKKNALMVVGSLIATMAFTAIVTPPKANENEIHMADYWRFYVVNTTSFVTSLSTILLLMSGLPIKNRLFMWILMVITWVAITSISLSYMFYVSLTIDEIEGGEQFYEILNGVVTGWLALMAVLLICHTLRLVWHTLRWAWRMVRKMVNCMIGPCIASRRERVNEGHV